MLRNNRVRGLHAPHTVIVLLVLHRQRKVQAQAPYVLSAPGAIIGPARLFDGGLTLGHLARYQHAVVAYGVAAFPVWRRLRWRHVVAFVHDWVLRFGGRRVWSTWKAKSSVGCQLIASHQKCAYGTDSNKYIELRRQNVHVFNVPFNHSQSGCVGAVAGRRGRRGLPAGARACGIPNTSRAAQGPRARRTAHGRPIGNPGTRSTHLRSGRSNGTGGTGQNSRVRLRLLYICAHWLHVGP